MSHGFLEPAYGSRSLADVLPAVSIALGSAPHSSAATLDLPPAPAYVVFLVDGLGADLLASYAHAAPYLSSLLTPEAVATAGVPSTTATSLTSLGTGLTPGAHGVVGFTSRVPGSDRLLNALFWDKDVDPVQWQPHPTLFQTLESAGVHVTTVNKREFRASGLTVAAHRGGEWVDADRVGERVAGAVTAAASSPSLTYLYDGDLDWTGHRYGVASPSGSSSSLSSTPRPSSSVTRCRPRPGSSWSPTTGWSTRRSTTGWTSTTTRRSVRVSCCSVARRGSGTSTAPAALSPTSWPAGPSCSVTGPRCSPVTRRSTGAGSAAVSPSVLPRLGDVVAAARDDWGFFSSVDFPYELRLVGLHGSLTPVEMRIPLLVD